ncbi:hypothetical protein [Salinisphaera orenii]|uniref:Uncharacterized protein n=1 Tax=Salinisphaera orenii YIM 95161 TaxID=1051139 RepID=A0A423PRQ6_9GAMM|nr:hypothetical protein [Salinisphaera halophila]ROO28263.1 hypothetical protein SAHL_10665 [Salinisphaera halophila YIM 95161]
MTDYWRIMTQTLREGADLLDEMLEEKAPLLERNAHSFEERLDQEFWRGRCHQARDVMNGLDRLLGAVGESREPRGPSSSQDRPHLSVVVDNTQRDHATK